MPPTQSYQSFSAREADDPSEAFLGLDSEDRTVFVSICKSIATTDMAMDPNGDEFLDSVSYLVMWNGERDMHQVFVVDDGTVHNFCISFGKNESGRIISIDIPSTFPLWWDLPPIIGRLEFLTFFSIGNCRSLPHQALSTLPRLDRLLLYNCSEYPAISLPHLRVFAVGGGFVCRDPLFRFVKERLPNVQLLVFEGCAMDERHLESLLFEVLPHVSTISHLILKNNNVRSLRSIAERSTNRNYKNFLFKPKLCSLLLDGNPILQSIDDSSKEGHDPEEIEAARTFLGTFPTIRQINTNWRELGSDIRLELLLNMAGRRMIEGVLTNHGLPFSVWPKVLAKLQRNLIYHHYNHILRAPEVPRVEDVNTALFHVLREGFLP